MFLSAIVLVTPPTEPDRPGVLRPGWLRPAITLYGDTTVLQAISWFRNYILSRELNAEGDKRISNKQQKIRSQRTEKIKEIREKKSKKTEADLALSWIKSGGWVLEGGG